MRMIREVLRLKLDCGLSDRQIAQTAGIARSTIGEYVRRFRESGLVWPLSAALQDRDLETCLFPPPPSIPSDRRPVPDWPSVHAELRRKGVTLFLLWQEYKAINPDGFQYSWFCDSYQVWRSRRDRVMRQTHRVGETNPPGADWDARSAPAGRIAGSNSSTCLWTSVARRCR